MLLVVLGGVVSCVLCIFAGEDTRIPFGDQVAHNRCGGSGLHGILNEYLWIFGKGLFEKDVLIMLFSWISVVTK